MAFVGPVLFVLIVIVNDTCELWFSATLQREAGSWFTVKSHDKTRTTRCLFGRRTNRFWLKSFTSIHIPSFFLLLNTHPITPVASFAVFFYLALDAPSI